MSSLFNDILEFSDYKAYGLNYYGAKKLIAPQLLQKMHELHYERHGVKAKIFIDCFGGGGSMSLAALQVGYKAIYNEARADLCLFFNELKRRDLPFEWCNADEFKEILKIPREKRTLEQVCKNIFFSWNFGGLTYANVTKNEQMKEIFCLLKEYGVKNEIRKEFERDILGKSGDCGFFLSYFNLNEARNALDLDKMQVINGDYKDLNLSDYKPSELMIYADIPYQDKKSKASYKGVYFDGFNLSEFLAWSQALANKGHNVFVSEYNAPSEDFSEVLSLKKWVFGGNNGVRYEKLFLLKGNE